MNDRHPDLGPDPLPMPLGAFGGRCTYCQAIPGNAHTLDCPHKRSIDESLEQAAQRLYDRERVGLLVEQPGLPSWAVLDEVRRMQYRDRARAALALVRPDTPPQGEAPVIPPAPVDHIRPKHYGGADDPYEPLKVMLAQHGREAVISFCWLTAEKYLARAGKKPGEPIERDFRKAAFYLTHAAELLEKKP